MGLALWFWTLITGSRFKGLLYEGERLLAAERFTEALEHFRLAAQEWPERPEGYLGMGDTYRAMGLDMDAQRETAVGQALRQVQDKPDDLAGHMQLARGFMEKGLVPLALTQVEKALRLSPQGLEALKLAALVYRQNRQFGRALAMIKQALQLEPLNGDLYEQRALNHRALNNQLEAAKSSALAGALRALVKEPGRPDLVEKAVFQLGANNLRHLAVEVVERSLKAAPDKAQLHVLYGEMLLDKGNAKAALQSLLKAFQLDPTVLKVHQLLTQAYLHLGDQANAERHRLLALALEDARSAADAQETEVKLVKMLLDAEREDLARARAEALIQGHPQDWRGMFALGEVHQRLGKEQEALVCLAKAAQLSPNNPRIVLARAGLFSQLGEVVEAVGQARQAVTLAPRDPSVRRALAVILRRHGHLKLAQEEEELAEAMSRRAGSSSS